MRDRARLDVGEDVKFIFFVRSMGKTNVAVLMCMPNTRINVEENWARYASRSAL
jgi:hypothetical protein